MDKITKWVLIFMAVVLVMVMILSHAWAGEREEYIKKGDKELEVVNSMGNSVFTISDRQLSSLKAIAYYLRAMLEKEETNEKSLVPSDFNKFVPDEHIDSSCPNQPTRKGI